MAQICDPSKSMYDPPNEESNRFNRVDLWTDMGGGMASLPANGVLSQTQCILHIQLPGGTQLSNQSFTEGQERSFEEAGTTYYLTATTIYPSATLNLVKVTSCYDAPDQQKQATLTGQIITPTPHSIGQTISFKGKLTYNGQAIPGKRLDLIKLTNNASVSNAITNSSGEATLTYTVDQWDPKDIPFLIGAYYLAPDYFTIETNQLNITLADSEKPTTLTITPSPPADETGYREGDIITLTVTLKDQDGSPLPNTTPVKYYKGSTYIGESFLSYGQTQAQYIVKATDKDLSPITLTAKFEGMERYLPSQQSTAPLTISPANGAIQPTSLTLAAAPVKEIYNWNDNITLSAQLSTSSNPQPPDQSQVKFYNDTTLIGTGPNLIMGVTFIEYTVQPTPTQIQAGTMTLKATFAGIEGYSASEKTLTIKISPEIAPPQKEDVQFTLTLKPEKETYLHGESIEITATLLDKTSTPINGAEVDFYINGAFLKEVYTSLGGYAVATYLVQTNQITTKEIKTSYYGDTLHNAKDLTKTINVTNIPPSYDITVNAINVPAGGAPVRLHKITKLGQNPFTSENLYLLDWTVFKKTATSPSDSVIFSSKEWVNLKQYDGYTFAIYMGDPTSGIITESQAQIITLKDKSTHNLSSLIVPGDIAGPMCKLFGISTTDCPNFTTTLATDLLVPYSDLSIIINGIDPFTGQPRQATWWNYAFTALYLLPFAKLGTTAISKGGLLLSKYIDEAPTLKYFLESDSAIFHLIGGTSDNLDKATELAKTGKFEELKQFLDNLGPASADAIETFKTELRKIDGMTEDLIQRILYHSKILQTPLEQLKNFADLLVSNGAFYEGQLDIVRALIKSNPEDARIAFGTIDEPTWKILQSDLLTLQDGYITRAYILEMLHTIKPLDPTIISDKIATLLTDLSKVNRTPIDSRGEVWLIRYAINTFPDHLSARLKYIDPDDWTQIISVLDQNGMSDLANLLKPLRILDNFDLISLLDGIIKLNAPVTMDGHKFIKQIARVEPNRFVSALGKYTDDELLLTIERLLEGGATEIPGIQLGHFLRQTSKFKQILLESPELTNLVPDIAAAMESIGNDIPTLELVDIVSDQIIKVTNAAQELRPLAPSKATTFKKFFTELRINPKNIKLTIINSLDDIRIAWNQADTLTRLKYIRNVISTTGTLAFLFWLVYDPISLYVFATWLYETARGTAPGNVTKNGDRYVSRISTLYYETNNACRDNNIDYLKTQLPIYKESIDELIQFIESNESNLIEEQSLNQANKAVETYSNHYNEMLNCAGLATIDLPIPADGILKNVHITKITDGDSFDATWDPGNLSEGQEPYIITGRMIGINAPEYSGDDYRLNCSSTPIGIVPLVANKDIYDKASINLIAARNNPVDLLVDLDDLYGSFGRLLTVVTQGDMNFNIDQVAKGYACVNYDYGANTARNSIMEGLIHAQYDAIQNKLGIWALPPTGEYGYIEINSSPATAAKYINGKFRDFSNKAYPVIPDTPNEVIISKEGYDTFHSPIITVAAGETTPLSVILTKTQIPSGKGIANFFTTPTAVMIWINDEYIGKTTSNALIGIELDPGIYKATFTKFGYNSITKSFTITEGTKTTVETATLTEEGTPEGPTGTATFQTKPSAVQVWVDGNFIGNTSNNILANKEFTVGTHSVRFAKSRYIEQTQNFTITENIPVNVSVTLTEEGGIEGPTGIVTFTTNPTSTLIYVDNIYLGYTINTVLPNKEISAGLHTFRFTKTGYLEETRTLTINENTSINLEVTLTKEDDSEGGSSETTGTVNFTTNPSEVEIWVNGSIQGTTTNNVLLGITLDPGTYTAIFKKPGYINQQKPFTIRSGLVTGIYAGLEEIVPPIDTAPVTLISTPTGAIVYMDGQFLTTTKRTAFPIIAGEHEFMFAKEGYLSDQQTITIVKDTPAIITSTLEELETPEEPTLPPTDPYQPPDPYTPPYVQYPSPSYQSTPPPIQQGSSPGAFPPNVPPTPQSTLPAIKTKPEWTLFKEPINITVVTLGKKVPKQAFIIKQAETFMKNHSGLPTKFKSINHKAFDLETKDNCDTLATANHIKENLDLSKIPQNTNIIYLLWNATNKCVKQPLDPIKIDNHWIISIPINRSEQSQPSFYGKSTKQPDKKLKIQYNGSLNMIIQLQKVIGKMFTETKPIKDPNMPILSTKSCTNSNSKAYDSECIQKWYKLMLEKIPFNPMDFK